MKLALLSLIALVSGTVVACGSSDSQQNPLPSNGNSTSVLEQPRGEVDTPDFTLRSTTGEIVRLSNYLGNQPLAVVFYRGFF